MEQISHRPADTRTTHATRQRPAQKNPEATHASPPGRKMYPPTHGRSISEDIAEYLSVFQRPPSRRWRDN